MQQAMLGAALVMLLAGVEAKAANAGEPPDWNWLVVTDGPAASQERQAIVEALRLLPRLPERVAVIDAEAATPEVRATLLGLDAFTIRGRAAVYVVRQSPLFRGAIAGVAFHRDALASVLWHEMAHAEGGDEREARRREETLWMTFVRDQRVDQVTALRYLNALAKRPDAQMVATR